ncbi:MAG: hypothetical protein CMI09_08880 [Oceanospirillaceae bacterium]|nr:hypothetical protein [Oceanospirillaceae bacterium]
MTSELIRARRGLLYTAMAAATAMMLTACGSDDDNDSSAETPVVEETVVAKPAMPTGLGYEAVALVPSVEYPLPGIDNLPLNDGNGRFYRDNNPILTALAGINQIWKGTTEQWQTTAGDYTDADNGYKAGDGPNPHNADNGYKAGDGPNPHNAANGKPSDYVAEGTEIVDSATWEANIKYVEEVTAARTDDQALWAFLDDYRSKSYSTIDGFGPMTEDYAANSDAYADTPSTIYLTDVLEAGDGLTATGYRKGDNDSYSTYGGQTDTALGDVVALAKLFRDSYASTSGPKYVFGTPRPWRMNSAGEVKFQEVETLTCIDGKSEDRAVTEYRIDKYESNVSLVPGLYCGRRAHSSSKEAELLYTATTENRRKDNGYPSGHTNAGILASTAYAYANPERFVQHVLRGSQLGENRILAGMHSPVDVIGGRIQALMVASYALNHNPDVADSARANFVNYFGAKAADAEMSLYDYANREVTEGSFRDDTELNLAVFNNNWFADKNAAKVLHTERMTYGLPQNGTRGLAPVVPEGAEALLGSRFPYLSDEQRRVVLATTEIESGYPLLDASNGWGRINLAVAGDGYGAFEGDVNVYMNAALGGFNAEDVWGNDISGSGKLTKSGSGVLSLSGDNSFSGGAVIEGGALVAESASAFGTGTVYVAGGDVVVDAEGELAVSNLVVDATGTLAIEMDADAVQVAATGTAYVAGASLELSFESAPAAGTAFTLLTADKIGGEFATVSAGEVDIELSYSDDKVVATVQ